MMKRLFLLLALAAVAVGCTPKTTLYSPDGRNVIAFDAAAMIYTVLRDGDTVIRPSLLGIETSGGLFGAAAVAETATSDNPYFMTGAGGLLQAVLFGFGGLEITDEGIVDKYTMPQRSRFDFQIQLP